MCFTNTSSVTVFQKPFFSRSVKLGILWSIVKTIITHLDVFSVNLSSEAEDKLKIYRENFEKAYLEATKSFYKLKAPQYLAANGVQNYMRYADAKLKEEEARAMRYLETGWGLVSVSAVSLLSCSTFHVC